MKNINNYKSTIAPTWCPGCGNHIIFSALNQALNDLKIDPCKLVIVTDIGCSGNMADFLNCYVVHSLHGRALPMAAGIKLGNHKLTVLVVTGDGGCYGEGLGHLISLMRGNHDIKVLVHNNYLYSLTTGQASPTTLKGTITKTTPKGVMEEPLNPILLSLANHITFCARGYSFNQKHLNEIIKKAITHQGFSLVDILQPCITLNKEQTLAWYQNKVYFLEKPITDKTLAFKKALETDKLPCGIFCQVAKKPYHQLDDSLKEEPLISKKNRIDFKDLMEEFI